jgi:hypothetical protein
MQPRRFAIALAVLLLGTAVPYPVPAHASFSLTIEGHVESLDEHFVVLRKEATLVKVPRRTIQSRDLRPGQRVTSIVDAKTTIETWPAKDASRSK